MFGWLLYKAVCNFAGFLYPAYASFKAIKVNDTKSITPWLMYWIVMAFFSVAEAIIDKFIFWLPFYYEFKMLFVLWLIMPQTQGATFLYQSLVDPTLTRHEQEIDSALALAQEQATTTGAEWGRQGLATLQRVAVNGLSKGQHILNEQTRITELGPNGSSLQERSTSTIISKNGEQTKEQASLLSYIFSSYNKLSAFSSLIPDNNNLKNSILPEEIINASPRERQVYIQKQRKQLERMLKNLDDAQEDIYTRTEKSEIAYTNGKKESKKIKSNDNNSKNNSIRNIIPSNPDEEDNQQNKVKGVKNYLFSKASGVRNYIY
ncbi:hypothetical protein Glove_186g169 [Diversispora epigaea]|uniref:Protein YOP1 n=1 Tax=Diversispora epigaea TaxID=1348612 RepID=A0A397IRU6_9GLOM|nr:hypothetical protein Glove_186g169 [Diversispora epigaea]